MFSSSIFDFFSTLYRTAAHQKFEDANRRSISDSTLEGESETLPFPTSNPYSLRGKITGATLGIGREISTIIEKIKLVFFSVLAPFRYVWSQTQLGKKNIEGGIKCSKTAAEQRELGKAYFSLGTICLVEKEEIDRAIQYYELASRCFEIAARQGGIQAKNELGRACLLLGVIYRVRKEDKAIKCYELAIKCFKAAARQGDHEAKNQLGLTYFLIGAIYQIQTKGIDRAIEYFKLSAKQGHVGGRFALFKLTEKREEGKRRMAPGHIYPYDRKNLNKVIAHFEIQANLGDCDAQIITGRIYQYDRINLKRAMKYFYLAAEQGSFEAQVRLGSLMQENCCSYAYENGGILSAKDLFNLLDQKGASKDQIGACLEAIGIDKVNQKLTKPWVIDEESCQLHWIVRQAPILRP